MSLDTGKTALVSCLNLLDQHEGFAESDHSDDPDFIEPRESAKICRGNNPLVVHILEARIFIAVATWANKYDIRTFMLFPELLRTDCTCNSNNTNNHLLTFSCPTSSRKQVVGVPACLATKPEEVLLLVGFQICTHQPVRCQYIPQDTTCRDGRRRPSTKG